MSEHADHYANILKFWRSAETFVLPDISLRNQTEQYIYTELRPGMPLPWNAGELPEPRAERRWKHTLYFYVIDKESVVDLLARLTGSTEFREPVGGDTCASALVVDQLGRPGYRSYAPASFIYAIKLIREKRDPEQLTELLKQAQEQYVGRFELAANEEPTAVSWVALQKELDHLQGLVRGTGATAHGAGASRPAANAGQAAGSAALPAAHTPVLCVSEQVGLHASLEAPFLNSYFLHDLNALIQHPADLGRPLQILLTPQVDSAARTNLLEPANLLAALHPKHQGPGRWPSNPAHGLYSAQQAALNLVLPALRREAGLFGINGPPGTGKTTLLREVIADVVVSRARRLLDARVNDLFAVKRVTIHDRTSYYPIDQAIFGNDGIVVSSNNNTAIENISKELPALRSIDRAAFPEAEYFSRVATSILGEPSWGMLSAMLGRSERRTAFVDSFWFEKSKSFKQALREQAEDPMDTAAINFASTAVELRGLLAEYAEFQALASEYHEALMGTTGAASTDADAPPADAVRAALAGRLASEYGVVDLPDGRWLDMAPAAIHPRMPYSSEKLNTLRSNIFLRSLELHEWAICANARYFQTNLGAFVDMLANKHRDYIDEGIAATLWNSFFFCIPVVSVTLASFQRQFSKLGAGAIGWLLLDEAGQATLPSVCGAIWRSKRCILIGDTLQIPPVVTIPRGLSRLLQEHYGIADDCWSPVEHSAQFLADRVTATGAYIHLRTGPGNGLGDATWTGIPLRAHRRCAEPMFSLANTIAYNGQMVRVHVDTPPDALPTGPSGWIDVAGITVVDGHALEEELLIAGDLLQQLVAYPGKIYLISPFRSVASTCYERFYKKDRVECGTIHTFQGKEAGIVILVLGTTAANKKARNWVAASPNILNVAVTRARDRLYVIGNRQAWGMHNYFDYLARVLPEKEHISGRFF